MLYFSTFLFYYDDTVSRSSDGQLIRARASEVVDLDIIQSPMKPKTQKLVFTVSKFDAQH